jgi:hypothetical protein
MASPWLTVSTVWALASAVGVAVIGLGVLRHHQVRPRGRLAFGAFTLVGGDPDRDDQPRLDGGRSLRRHVPALVSVASQIPLAYFLLEVGAAHSPSGGSSVAWRILRGAAVGLTVGAALLFALDTSLLFRGVTLREGAFFANYGVLHNELVGIPQLAALPVALLSLHGGVLEAPTVRSRGPTSVLAAGLAL